jgi:hypothetical protein
MVIYVLVDGLRLDSWLAATMPQQGDTPDALAEVFGYRLDKSTFVIDAHAPFPSVTFAANASLVTGVPISAHGIAGNTYLDRDTGTSVDFTSAAGLADVFRRGVADKRLRRPPLYTELSQKSLVSFHFFGKGADWVTPKRSDAVWYTKEPGRYDYFAAGRLLGRLRAIASRKESMPSLAVLYLPGLDGVSHHKGVSAQVAYVRKQLNATFRALLDGPVGAGGGLREMAGGLSNFTFVLTADHGFNDVRRWIASADVAAAIETGLAEAPEYRDLSPQQLAECYQLAANGGMMHVYLRYPGASWHQRLFQSDRGRQIVKGVALALRASADLDRQVDLVLAALTENGKLSGISSEDGEPTSVATLLKETTAAHPRSPLRYFGAEAAIEGLGSAGGDILLTAAADRGYGFLEQGYPASGVYRAIHGNLFTEEMRVPLVMAGRGIEKKTVRGVGPSMHAAPILAQLVGETIVGRPPPLLKTVKDASPLWLNAPRQWAEVNTLYAAQPTAFSPTHLPLTICLREGPEGMTFDSATGILKWWPKLSSPPVVEVVLEAIDTAGRATSLRFPCTVFPKSPADVTVMPTDEGVAVRWSPVENAKHYAVRRIAPPGHPQASWRTEALMILDTAPLLDRRATYIVETVDASGRISGQLTMAHAGTR